MKITTIAVVTVATLAFTAIPAMQDVGESMTRSRPTVQLLALNDLHGNLDAVPGAAGAVSTKDSRVQAGGVARIATLMDKAREGQANTLTVAAGDMIGGSPLVSAAYHDEPTVEALGALGVAASSVGNHEFDEGRAELLRMVRGGCHPVDGCAVAGDSYVGTPFPYLAANVVDTGTGEPILPPYWIKEFEGFRVGFIGLATRDVPSVVVRDGIEGLEFRDEVETIDRYAKELSGKGVKAIVTLIHEGGVTAAPEYDYDCDAGGPGSGLSGPIKDIAERVDSTVDLIVSGHSHEAYVCNVPDPEGNARLVTQAASFGRTFTDIRFQVNPETGDVVRQSEKADNLLVSLDTPEDPKVRDVVETWRARSTEVADEVVGHISADLPGRGSTEPETPLGDLITDSQAEATGATVAFLNAGGMRGDLVYKASGGEGDGVVTYGECFQVQPFGNVLVSMDLTGAQLLEVLRQQYSGANAEYPRQLQSSSALTYRVDLSKLDGERILKSSVRVNGKRVRSKATYRVAANNFLADGGNGFTAFEQGTGRANGAVDLDAFVVYVKARGTADDPIDPSKADRVTFG